MATRSHHCHTCEAAHAFAPDTTLKAPKHSLFTIPPELRLLIYDLILIEPGPLRILLAQYHEQPPLLATCHQIRNEAIGMYYTLNTFVIGVDSWCGRNKAKLAGFGKLLNLYRNEHVRDTFRLQVNPWSFLALASIDGKLRILDGRDIGETNRTLPEELNEYHQLFQRPSAFHQASGIGDYRLASS